MDEIDDLYHTLPHLHSLPIYIPLPLPIASAISSPKQSKPPSQIPLSRHPQLRPLARLIHHPFKSPFHPLLLRLAPRTSHKHPHGLHQTRRRLVPSFPRYAITLTSPSITSLNPPASKRSQQLPRHLPRFQEWKRRRLCPKPDDLLRSVEQRLPATAFESWQRRDATLGFQDAV